MSGSPIDEGESGPIVRVHGFASNKETNWVMPGWTAYAAARTAACWPGFRSPAPRSRGAVKRNFCNGLGAKTKRGSGRRRCQGKISERPAAKTGHPYGNTRARRPRRGPIGADVGAMVGTLRWPGFRSPARGRAAASSENFRNGRCKNETGLPAPAGRRTSGLRKRDGAICSSRELHTRATCGKLTEVGGNPARTFTDRLQMR
jgi:hypothetical protein